MTTDTPPFDYSHRIPPLRVASGASALAVLERGLAQAGSERTVLVTSPSLVREGSGLDDVRACLDTRLVAEFTDVRPHSPVASVEALAEVLRENAADAVVGVGGGSVVVSSRAAVILHGEGRGVRDLCTQRGVDGTLVSPRLAAPKVPVWLVPSTPTTAAVKAGAAVRDDATGERLALFDPAARAKGVVFHPPVVDSAPIPVLIPSALNACVMAVESLQANLSGSPLPDASLSHALRVTAHHLPALTSGDDTTTARIALMGACVLAGRGSDLVGRGGVAQALSHALGPRSHVPNGTLEAILLPHTLRFLGLREDRLELVLHALGRMPAGSDDAATAAATWSKLLTACGLPLRLRDVGVAQDVLEDTARHAMDDWALARAVRPVTLDDARALLDAAW